MTSANLLLGILLALTAMGCGRSPPAVAEHDGTLGNWYPDGYVLEDTELDVEADAAGADAIPDTGSDASLDALSDLPDVTTPDALATDATADTQADTAEGSDVQDGSVADVADTPDAPDIADVPDTPDISYMDAGPLGVCFKGAPPSDDASIADIAPTDPATCPAVAPPATWFSPVPAPTLDITPGFLGENGTFVAYKDDDWVPMNYGMQGAFHIWAGFTVAKVPDATAATVPLDVQIWADTACVTVASSGVSKVSAMATTDGKYSNVFAGSSGVQAQFNVPAASSGLYCGIWIHLHIRVHDSASGAWGEAVRTLRVYDSKP